MKPFLSLLFVVLFCEVLFSQTELQIGLYPKGRFAYVTKNALPNQQGGTEFLFHFKPGIIFRHHNNAIIAKYSHSFAWSDFEDIPIRRSFHLSYRRYFVKEFSRFKWSDKVTLFAELENIIQDWIFDKNGAVPLGSFKALNISPMLGFELYFLEKFKFEYGNGYRIYPKYSNHFDLFFGITYRII